MAAKAGVFISVVGKNDPRGFAQARAELRSLETQAKTSSGGIEGALSRASSKLEAIGSKMRDVGKKMTLGVTLPILGLGAVSFKLASDLNESQSKVQRVFGATSRSIESFANRAAENLGLSKQEALEAAGTFGNLFRAMGIGQEKAGSLSQQLLLLSADLASFNNANPADVLEALRSGLVGETEPLRQFGINLNEARIKAEALRLGLVRGTQDTAKIAAAQVAAERAQVAYTKAVNAHGKESLEARSASAALGLAQERLNKEVGGSVGNLTAAQKAQAAYSLIMHDSKIAQGDFARTSSGAANQQRILTARLKDLGAEIGGRLLPIGTQLLSWVSGLIAGLGKLPKGVQTVIVVLAALAAAAGPAIYALGGLATALGFIAANPVVLLIAALAAIVAAIVVVAAKWDQVWGAIRDNPALAVIAATLFPIIVPIVAIGGAIHWLADNWASVWATIRSIVASLQPVIDAVAGFVGEQLADINEWLEKNRATFEQAFANIAAVVSFAVGAIAVALRFLIDNVARPAFEFWLSVAVPILQVAWRTIQAVIEGAIRVVEGIIQTVLAVIAGDWGSAWDGILLIVSGVWQIITGLIGGALGYVRAIIAGALGAIAGIWSSVWSSLISLVSRAWSAITGAVAAGVGGVIAWVAALPGQIIGLFADLPGRMLELGGQIVQGIKDGIDSAWGGLMGWVGDRVDDLKHALTHPWEVFSPSKYTRRLGGHIVEGMRLGLADGLPALGRTADRMRDTVQAGLGPLRRGARAQAFAATATGSSGVVGAAGGGTVVHVQFGDVRIDARGATDPRQVESAARSGMTSAVRELTRSLRSA